MLGDRDAEKGKSSNGNGNERVVLGPFHAAKSLAALHELISGHTVNLKHA
jgi:hypothetical protein